MTLWLLIRIWRLIVPLHTLCTSALCRMLLCVIAVPREGLLAFV